jgi:hypothetical protein
LVTTTLLALFVVPALTVRFGQPRQVGPAGDVPPPPPRPVAPEREPEPTVA